VCSFTLKKAINMECNYCPISLKYKPCAELG
jgi:hypothetical protein